MSKYWILKIVLISTLLTITTKSLAEIVPDNTLGSENTIVNNIKTQNGTLSNISGGATRGSNLFHSLLILNINKGDEVNLFNGNNVNKIFVRVTGGNSSTIDGILRSKSNAELFLINQRGLIIHRNSIFDVGGSLVLTTSSKIGFSDGNVFTSLGDNSKFSSGEPVILSFDGSSGNIAISGNGHTIIQNVGYPTTPYTANLSKDGSIFSGENITIAGNGINLDGGIISNSTGKVNIFSIKKGNIFGIENNNITFSDDVTFANLSLNNHSLIFTKGNGNGAINLYGKNISLEDRSLVIAGNYGKSKGGDITINAVESLRLSELDNTFSKSLIWSENASDTLGSNIYIYAKNLELKNAVGIASFNYGNGKGGSIYVNILDSLQGTSSDNRKNQDSVNPIITSINLSKGQSGNTEVSANSIDLSDFSIIGNFCYGGGNCGDVKIKANYINLYSGSVIGSDTFGLGNSGSVYVDSNEINISGYRKFDFSNSVVITTSFAQGSAGNIVINTDYLNILNNGAVAADALSK